MRSLATLLFLSFLVPFFASAALTQSPAGSQAPPVVASKCPKGYSTGDPSGTRSFSQSQISTLQSYLQQAIYCANACFDVRTSISISSTDSSLSVRTTATNRCANKEKLAQDQTPPRGCAKGQTQPTVIADVPAIIKLGFTIEPPHKIGPKSRCDTSISSIVNSMFGRIGNSDLDGFRSDIASLQNLPSVTPPSINVGPVNGSEQIAKELAAGTGIDISAARKKVAEDPIAAIAAINAISTGDDEQAKRAVRALGLNPDLADRAALQAAIIQNNGLSDPNEDKTRETEFGLDRTGFTQGSQVLPHDVLNGGQGACYVVTNSFGTQPACMFTPDQVDQLKGNLVPVVASYYCTGSSIEQTSYGGICNPNGFNIASKELPNGTRVLLFNPQSGQAIVATVNDRGPFVRGRDVDLTQGAAQALGVSGVNNLHMVVLGSSGSIGSLGQYASVDVALKAYQDTNGAIAVGDGNISVVASRAVSPFASFLGGSTSGSVNTYGSPFANLSPVPIGYPTTTSAPTGGYTAPSQTFQQTPTQQQPVSQTLSQTTQGQSTSGQSSMAQQLIDALRGGPATTSVSGPSNPPVATIIVQPHTILRGNSITASWSSVGMSSASPCQVFVNKVFLLGQGNEGSKRVATDSSTSATLTFTLRCTTQSGQIMERNDSATIH
ncbi:MAG: septal ring lytic transglycosylase RlpA family protein [bacterium]|nr:septal ring lytic transglycosylase RlpA family protein [bacterium]